MYLKIFYTQKSQKNVQLVGNINSELTPTYFSFIDGVNNYPCLQLTLIINKIKLPNIKQTLINTLVMSSTCSYIFNWCTSTSQVHHLNISLIYFACCIFDFRIKLLMGCFQFVSRSVQAIFKVISGQGFLWHHFCVIVLFYNC